MRELTDIGYVREVLERHGFACSKALGQNFLVNPTVCPRIAEMGNAAPGWGVLEIGTGIGTLTKELAKRADKVCAVELDQRLFPILDETLADFENVKIFHGDAMKYDLAGLIGTEFAGCMLRSAPICRIISHLPSSCVCSKKGSPSRQSPSWCSGKPPSGSVRRSARGSRGGFGCGRIITAGGEAV